MILQISRQLTSLRFRFLTLFYEVERRKKGKLSKEALNFGKHGFFERIHNFVKGFTQIQFQHPILSLTDMGKTAGGFYAVARGRSVGIYNTWDECKAQVNGFQNARYKKFSTSGEAQTFINENQSKPGTSFPAAASFTKPKPIINAVVAAGISTSPKTGRTIKTGTTARNAGAASKVVVIPPRAMPSNVAQKRSLSSMKVTEDRVINKRTKMDSDPPNRKANLETLSVDDEGYVVVFTDGACSKNGRKAAKAGIGVWFGHGNPLNISEPVSGRQTNNTAEIQAAERAIRQAKQNGINKLKVKTDSQFTINCVTKWMNNWKRNNWRLSSGGDVKNKEDLINLDTSMQNMEIKWSYVAGHKGIEGNEAADRLAVAGAERS